MLAAEQPQRTSFLVVGAGVTGLTAALLLARRGAAVTLWESGERPGGLLAPVHVGGVACDRGSHRLHPDAHPLLFELTSTAGWLDRPRAGRLLLGGRQLRYPPRPVDFMRGLGWTATADMARGFVTRPGALRAFRRWEQDRSEGNAEDGGFEAFVLARVGRGAYERFYRPYVEKVWGTPPAELSRSVAKQRVSISSPVRALSQALSPRRRGAPHFKYPARGMAGLVADLHRQLRDAGVRIELGHTATLAELRASGYQRIVYTGHLSDLLPAPAADAASDRGAAAATPSPSGADVPLGHRGLYLLHLVVEAQALTDADTYYAPEAAYWFGRVSRVDRFSPWMARPGEAILCAEIPEGRWGPGRSFTNPAMLRALLEQLCEAKILRRGAQPTEVLQTFLPRVYPMYRRGWLTHWRAGLRQAMTAEPRVIPVGRQGLFLHCNLDHCVRMAEEAVTHALSDGSAEAWQRQAELYLDLRVRD